MRLGTKSLCEDPATATGPLLLEKGRSVSLSRNVRPQASASAAGMSQEGRDGGSYFQKVFQSLLRADEPTVS